MGNDHALCTYLPSGRPGSCPIILFPSLASTVPPPSPPLSRSFLSSSPGSSPLAPFSCLPSGSIHPFVHPCMHGCPPVRGFCLCCTQAHGTALPLRRPTPAETLHFRPANFICLSKRDGCCFSLHSMQVQTCVL